ncbi:class I SAM-dependent methyltransferase [Rhizobium sp. IMFF44]|uniref:class I SAM-dependent methyltransferase n=1 Tax=Rhizobium sp. IMFF44 TaxID=3342350 RepID=UPI0035B72D09
MLDEVTINKAYHEILGRDVDEGGLLHFLGLAHSQKLTFGRLLYILSSSEEFESRDEVSRQAALEYRKYNSHPSEKIHWFHSIALSDGFVTNGMQTQAFAAKSIFKYPVEGKTVLDIGAWDGFYSYKAEELGAKDVLATDWYCWGGPGWGTKEGFEYAHRDLKSKVRSLEADVFALDPEKISTFDTVLFLGVLYHLSDPLAGLKKAAALSKSHLVVLTHAINNNTETPLLEYREGFNGDDTTFWYPNIACLKSILERQRFNTFDAIKVEEGPEGVPTGSGCAKGVDRYTLHAFR